MQAVRSAELARSALLDAEEAHEGERTLAEERLGTIQWLERKVDELQAQVGYWTWRGRPRVAVRVVLVMLKDGTVLGSCCSLPLPACFMDCTGLEQTAAQQLFFGSSRKSAKQSPHLGTAAAA